MALKPHCAAGNCGKEATLARPVGRRRVDLHHLLACLGEDAAQGGAVCVIRKEQFDWIEACGLGCRKPFEQGMLAEQY